MSRDAVRALNERAGCNLELLGLVEQGQSGAAYVRWPDGRDAVVTTALTTLEHMQQTAEVLAALKTKGLPVPEHEFLLPLDDGTIAVVQERLPGSTVAAPDTPHVHALITLNERFAGLLASRPDVPTPRLSLGRPTDAIPAELIERHSARARRLLRHIRDTADGGQAIEGGDLVHVDLTVPNALFDTDGAISGLVDWNYGVARGDRHYGLVKLLHNLSHAAMTADGDQHPTRQAVDHAAQMATAVLDPTTLRRYWAHQSLNMLYASIRWGTEDAVQTYLELGESRLS
ncbi:aminoglycoside phosphotransferase family protein [Actinopolymorpha sp. B9G3]|uniref:aminoglycoside phosphotransferase family protein n=1 Tax=Actinopolymorpha sp. B9G3 TaxID=3158970 RepID=UPI0032D8D7BA